MSELYDSITGTGSIEALETRCRELVDTRFAVAMCSATSAIHAALLAAGVQRGDEVIVPGFTWGGSVAGILLIGAIPVFADIDKTLTLDPEDVLSRLTSKTKAIIVVHLFGHPGDCSRLQGICNDEQITLIEDCAQAFGARDRERSVGSFGIGCFSFSAGKQLNIGEGGMLTTDDEGVYDRVLYYTQHPLRQRKDMLGTNKTNQFALNYRLASALAENALTKFEKALEEIPKRAREFEELSLQLAKANVAGLAPVKVRDGVFPSWHRYSPEIDNNIFDDNFHSIQSFLGRLGYQMESGYISEPLYRDLALGEYLPSRIRTKLRQIRLKNTELACETRIGIRKATPRLTE